MKKTILLISTLTLVQFCNVNAFAQSYSDDDGEYSGYNSIVRELSSSKTDLGAVKRGDDFDNIRFHFGVGLITSRVSFKLPEGMPRGATFHGYEARLGIDLFSPRWMAEGSVRSFDPEPIARGEATFKEFDLLLSYHAPIFRPLLFNIGAGMSARYLDFTDTSTKGYNHSNTTPASVFVTGLDFVISSYLSLGADVSYRSRLVSDTADDGSVDGNFRFSGHF